MSGFQHAEITKGLMVGLGLCTLSVSLLDIKPYFHLQLVPHMTQYRQIWRILVHPFVFANSTELVVGELLLYHVSRQIERSFGPRKFASFVLVSSAVSTFLSLLAIILFHRLGLNFIPAGPYGAIFALLWQYYRTVPSLYHFRVFGIELSSKVLQWVLASQLALSYPPASLLAATSGLVTGYLYRSDTLFLLPSLSRRRIFRPLKSYRLPLSLHLLLARVFGPLMGGAPAPRRANRVLPGQISAASSARAGAGGTPQVGLRSLFGGRVGGTPGGAGNATPQAQVLAPGAIRNMARSGAAPDTAGGGAPSTTASAGRGARAAVGSFVSEMTGGSGARAPTEEEIATLTAMFPNLGREVVVRALQRHDGNTALAVEALLERSM